MIFLSARASSNEIKNTNVVTLGLCESNMLPMDNMGKEDLHTFAELKHDPRASRPDSFTVCSNIMLTGCPTGWPTFFNIFDNNRGHFLVPQIRPGSVETRIVIRLPHDHFPPSLTGKVAPLFPNQWIKSCLAVNATSSLINWVIDGTLVLDSDFVQVKNSESRPKDLSRKLVLGASSYGDSWDAVSQKVTNLDIYSSPLPIEKMERITRGGSCVEEGDYLAWEDMEWILHGQAKKETTEKEETCEEKPLVDLYYTPFPGMDSCVHHCQNLGSRIPSVTAFEQWTKLQTFLRKKLFAKGLNTLQMWLPISDRETEGVWKDFYTGQVVENYTLPWIRSKPDGGKSENCARLINEDNWNDRSCDYQNFACMCSHKSSTTLTLRGLCPSSTIDVFYKPMNKQTDISELKLQGLTHTSIEFVRETIN